MIWSQFSEGAKLPHPVNSSISLLYQGFSFLLNIFFGNCNLKHYTVINGSWITQQVITYCLRCCFSFFNSEHIHIFHLNYGYAENRATKQRSHYLHIILCVYSVYCSLQCSCLKCNRGKEYPTTLAFHRRTYIDLSLLSLISTTYFNYLQQESQFQILECYDLVFGMMIIFSL